MALWVAGIWTVFAFSVSCWRVCAGILLPRGCHREGTLRHRRAINGNCVRSSLGGDRQHLCSALSQLLVLPPGEGSMAQRERLNCSLPHGPWTEVAQQQQLEHSSWLLPLLSREQAWGYPPAPRAEELQRSRGGTEASTAFHGTLHSIRS